MKTVVVYKSVSGFTKKYAEWIAEELKCDLFRLSEFSFKKAAEYETIIYGGPLHAAGIAGYSLIKKNMAKFSDKKIIVFACGASPEDDKVIKDIRDKNFPETDKNRISFFYLRGGFDFSKLDFKNRIIMSLFKKMLKKKKEMTDDEKGMLDSYDNPVDFTDRGDIKKIIDAAS